MVVKQCILRTLGTVFRLHLNPYISPLNTGFTASISIIFSVGSIIPHSLATLKAVCMLSPKILWFILLYRRLCNNTLPVIIMTLILASLSSRITDVVCGFRRFSRIIRPTKSKSVSTSSLLSFVAFT